MLITAPPMDFCEISAIGAGLKKAFVKIFLAYICRQLMYDTTKHSGL
jgi:hypothetical protein